MTRTRTVTAKGNVWFSSILPPFRGQPSSITSDNVTFVFSSFGALHCSVGFLGSFWCSWPRRRERQCRSASGLETNRHTHSCCVKEWGFRDVNLVDWLCMGGGALKALLWICVVFLLDYYSICLSEWENNIYISIRRIFGRVAKFEHNVSGSKVLT